MIIKPSGITNYSINPFYLYGFNETGLVKAFAFILSKDSIMLFKFLRYLGITNKNTEENYRAPLKTQIFKHLFLGKSVIYKFLHILMCFIFYSIGDFHPPASFYFFRRQ